MKCDVIALGLIAAVKEIGLKIPLVVRLQGTNVEAARKIMDDSGLRYVIHCRPSPVVLQLRVTTDSLLPNIDAR